MTNLQAVALIAGMIRAAAPGDETNEACAAQAADLWDMTERELRENRRGATLPDGKRESGWTFEDLSWAGVTSQLEV